MTLLKNGFTQLLKRTDQNGESVVLAVSESREEYATWYMDIEGNTSWGHYFPWYILGVAKESAYVQAEQDYLSR